MPIEHQRLYVGCEQIEEVLKKLRAWELASKALKKPAKADAYGMAIGLVEALIKD